jgi:ERCC4-type nuclease
MLAEQEQDARATAHEILMSLPGINVHNFREVTNKVENLSQLSKMTEAELSPLIGPANAKKLVTFFRQKVM